MVPIATILALAVFAQQPDPARQARDLAEKLRSEKPAEREEAVQKLKDLGVAAQPALEEAMKSADSAVAAQAAYLLRVIAVRKQLPETVWRKRPSIEDELARGDEHTWTEIFLRAISWTPRGSLVPLLTMERKTVDALAQKALEGAGGTDEIKRVVRGAGIFSLHSATPGVAKLLDHQDPSVRSESARALGRLAASDRIPKLLGLLNDRDQEVRFCAIESLASLRAEQALPELLKILRSSDERFLHPAIQALGELGNKEAVPELVKLLKHRDASLRVEAVGALVALQAEEVAAGLIELLNDGDLQSIAAVALARMGVREAVPRLIELLKCEDSRLAAVEALGYLKAREAAPDILRLLDDVRTREKAAEALGNLGATEAVPELIKLLGDTNLNVRRAAIRALGGVNAKEAVPALLEVIRNGDFGEEAADALVEMGAREAIPELINFAKTDSPHACARGPAVKALGMFGAKEAAPEISWLRFSVPVSAIRALARLDEKGAPRLIAPLLTDPDSSVRIAARESLVRLGSREGIDELLELADRYDGSNLNALNTFREPELCRRLREKTLGRELRGGTAELLTVIGKEAGIPVQGRFDRGPIDVRDFHHLPPHTSVLDAVEKIADLNSVILDRDRIRIIGKEPAIEFWKAWWEQENRKK